MKLHKLLAKVAISGFLLWFVGLYFVTPYFVSATPSASFVSEWGTFESTYTLQPSHMTIDPVSGDIYAIGNGNLHVFDSAGSLKSFFAVSNISSEKKVAAGPSGRKYYLDLGTNSVVIYDSSNALVSQFGSGGTGNGQLNQAWNLAYSFFNNKVYVADSGNHRIEVFDADGNYLSQWGTAGSGDGQFNNIIAMTISPVDGTVYTWDGRIQAFDADGNFLRKWGSIGTGDGQFSSQGNGVNMAVTPDGSKIYYLDRGNNRVQVFSDQGVFLSKFGSSGTGNGQFQFMDGVGVSPAGDKVYVADGTNKNIQVFNTSDNSYVSTITYTAVPSSTSFGYAEDIVSDANGNIYVTDSDNNRVSVFDKDGTFIRTFGSLGSGNGQLDYPTTAVVSPLNGDIYVYESGTARIQIFSNTGTYLSTFATTNGYGSADGQLDYVEDMTVDPIGNIYVVDSGNNRIQVFDKDGNFIRKWGSTGAGNGQLDYPTAIVYSPVNDHLYVLEAGNYRVQEFDTAGTFIRTWGTRGAANGQFQYGEGISVDTSGNVYVADSNNFRIEVFTKDGTFITTWGSSGSGNMQFDYPLAVTNYDGYVYVMDDIGKIKKYALDTIALPPTITTEATVVKPLESLTGTSEANATVTVSENGSTICTGTVDGSGNWTCTLSSPISATGEHTFSATQTDASGNISSESTKTIKIVSQANRSGSIPSSGGGGSSSSGFDPNKGNVNLPSVTTPTTPVIVTPTTPVTTGGTSCSTYFTQKVRLGSRNDEVRKVQQFLFDKGYYSGNISGFFGPLTQKSVKHFQEAYYREILIPLRLIEPTGNWSYSTMGLANNLLCAQ